MKAASETYDLDHVERCSRGARSAAVTLQSETVQHFIVSGEFSRTGNTDLGLLLLPPLPVAEFLVKPVLPSPINTSIWLIYIAPEIRGDRRYGKLSLAT